MRTNENYEEHIARPSFPYPVPRLFSRATRSSRRKCERRTWANTVPREPNSLARPVRPFLSWIDSSHRAYIDILLTGTELMHVGTWAHYDGQRRSRTTGEQPDQTAGDSGQIVMASYYLEPTGLPIAFRFDSPLCPERPSLSPRHTPVLSLSPAPSIYRR